MASALPKRGFPWVRKYAPVMWSWMAPMMGPPYLGDRMFSWTCSRNGDGVAVLRAEEVVCREHEDARLGAGLVGLQDVQVHLIAVEIGVVRGTDA